MEFKAKYARYSEDEVLAAYADFVKSGKPLATWAGGHVGYQLWHRRFGKFRLSLFSERGRAKWQTARRVRDTGRRQEIAEQWLNGATFEEVGARHGISRQRVHQIVRRVMSDRCPRCRQVVRAH